MRLLPGHRFGSRRTVTTVVVALVAAVSGVSVLLRGGLDPHQGNEDRSAVFGSPTPPLPGRPMVRLAVTGDTGTGDAAARATARRIAIEGRQRRYDGLLIAGDLIYDDGDSALLEERITGPFAPVLDQGTTLVPALGNHDYRDGEQHDILAGLGRTRAWYVERFGPVRVIVLDSNRVEAPQQTRWLRRVLAQHQASKGWTIALMHHPAYSAGKHGSDLRVRKAWSPLFAAADVPLVLAGHDHDYQRSKPQDGVTYVVSGGGAKLRETGRAHFTAVSTSKLHFLDLLFYRHRVIGRAIDQKGRLIDKFTLARPASQRERE